MAERHRGYILDSGNGRLIHRHVDQVQRSCLMSDVPVPGKESYGSEGVGGHDGGGGCHK